MAVDITKLQLRAKTSNAADLPLLEDALDEAKDRVQEYVTASGKDVSDIPPKAYDRAVIRCAIALFWQDKAQNGVLNQQYDLGDGEMASTPVRIGLDPMKSARVALNQWIPEFYSR